MVVYSRAFVGGFDLAAEWMGWENKFHCEKDEFCNKILSYYWPDAESFSDIKTADFTKYANKIDILTGGFPCQPYSLAGKRKGKEDERHLWPEMLRAIKEISPRWVVGENVFGLVNWSNGLVFHEVQTDLEAAGYEVFPYVLPACAVNAPHRRDRIWFVAHAIGNGGQEQPRCMGCTTGQDDRERARFIYDADKPNGETGPTPHAHDTRNITPGRGNIGNRAQDSSEREHTQPEFNGCGIDGDATNANYFSGRGGTGRKDGAEVDNSGNGDHANTGSEGLQRGTGQSSPAEKGKPEGYTAQHVPGWQNFPTQPPVCSRNDGFPASMDGITFPKWRTESIKAAGNAIVPQVAFQIFKAIEEYEKL